MHNMNNIKFGYFYTIQLAIVDSNIFLHHNLQQSCTELREAFKVKQIGTYNKSHNVFPV